MIKKKELIKAKKQSSRNEKEKPTTTGKAVRSLSASKKNIIQSASTSLNVQVNGGIAPLSIQVAFFKNGTPLLKFTASSSFTHVFDQLEDGVNYDITIGGFNPAGGNTVCSVTTDQITLTQDADPNPSINSGVSYRVDFNFTTK